MSEIELTQDEVKALSDYASQTSRARTFRLVRDTKNVLFVKEPSGRLYRLSPEKEKP